MSGPSVLVVGSTMMDMITYVDRIPADGETLAGKSFSLGFGGKGANQAVMARRLGAAVAMVGCLGDDVFGDMTLANLEREGIDTSGVARAANMSSGVAPIWVDDTGANRIIIVPGANEHLTEQRAAGAVAEAAGVDVVVGQFEIPTAVTIAGFRAAQARGALTVLNPAPFAPVPAELLAVTDFLVPNEVEFAGLTARDAPEVAIGDDELRAAARQWGVRLVVTLGVAGAAIAEPDGDVTRVPAPAVDAVDTTGAGDAFVGAFSFGMAAGWSVPDAARLGCACASDSVTRSGTQSSYPTPDQAARIVSQVSAEHGRRHTKIT